MHDSPARLTELLSDRYVLERELGSGGMATVYLAQDLKHGRRVALKVLRPELAAVIGPERFLSEIRLTANLQHPHLLPLFDSGEAGGLLYYVMPYVEGTAAREYMARFSPDGRWLAYSSNESGRDEVYVRPFPRTEGVGRLVSIGGGTGPVWAPDGSTLYYRGASREIMAVPTTLSPGFSAGRPRALFGFAGIYRMSGTATAYDIHPDGNRFIMVSEPDDQGTSQSPQQIHIVLNWFEELKRVTVPSR